MGRRSAILALAAMALLTSASAAHATDPAVLGPGDNPARLAPLPAPVPGQPLFQRTHGHLPFGLSDNAWSELDGDRRLMSADDLGTVHAAMGATLIRVPINWPTLEPEPGTRRWVTYDEVYRGLIRHGVRPLWTIYQTPRHAVAAIDRRRCSGVYCQAEPEPAQDQLLTDLGRDVAQRYPLSAGFELRNEPNHVPGALSGPVIAPERYTAELIAFGRGIRSGNRAMRRFGGALAMEPDAADYLDTMLERGAASALDGLTFHPYADTMQTFARHFEQLAQPIRRHGATALRLVPDESGYNTDPANTRQAAVDEAAQRDRLLEQFRAVDRPDPALALTDRVDAYIMFTTVDGRDDAIFRGMGWLKRPVDGRFAPKLAFCAFRREVSGLVEPFTGRGVIGPCPGALEARARDHTAASERVLRRCARRGSVRRVVARGSRACVRRARSRP